MGYLKHVHLHEMRTPGNLIQSNLFYMDCHLALRTHLTMVLLLVVNCMTAAWKDRDTNKWRPAPYILKAPSSHTSVF